MRIPKVLVLTWLYCAGVETEFWSFAGRAPGNPQNEPFLDWIYMVGNTSDSDVPKIFSTSCEPNPNALPPSRPALRHTHATRTARRHLRHPSSNNLWYSWYAI